MVAISRLTEQQEKKSTKIEDFDEEEKKNWKTQLS